MTSFIDSFLDEREQRRLEEHRDRALYVRPAVLKTLGLRLQISPPNERSEGQVHLVKPAGTTMLGNPEYVRVCWTVRPSWRGEIVLRRDERQTPVTCRKCRAWLDKQ